MGLEGFGRALIVKSITSTAARLLGIKKERGALKLAMSAAWICVHLRFLLLWTFQGPGTRYRFLCTVCLEKA